MTEIRQRRSNKLPSNAVKRQKMASQLPNNGRTKTILLLSILFSVILCIYIRNSFFISKNSFQKSELPLSEIEDIYKEVMLFMFI